MWGLHLTRHTGEEVKPGLREMLHYDSIFTPFLHILQELQSCLSILQAPRGSFTCAQNLVLLSVSSVTAIISSSYFQL